MGLFERVVIHIPTTYTNSYVQAVRHTVRIRLKMKKLMKLME